MQMARGRRTQRLGVQLPAPEYSFDISLLILKMPSTCESAANGAGQLQRLVRLLVLWKMIIS